MESKETLEALLNKYLDRKCTADEIRELLAYFEDPQRKDELQGILHRYFEQAPQKESTEEELAEKYIEELRPVLMAKIREEGSGYNRPLWLKLAAAAAVFLCLSAGLYFLLPSKSEPEKVIAPVIAGHNDVSPGGNKAVLILANGSKIILNDVKEGELVRQNGVSIIKTKNGQIINSLVSSPGETSKEAYNTISTPKGGQYQVVLPDGSRVWLNAASSLRYPAVFMGRSRVVELTGEAYFEISKDTARPFKVNVSGQSVEVLGTHFNINAYEDEQVMKTTLLEGSVRIRYKAMTALLKPGDQARVTPALSSPLQIRKGVDTEEAVAWKEGYFQFNHANIQEVMRQLSRWYDISVSYEGKPPEKEFGGAIQKDLSLSKVLKILEKSDMHFKIRGKEVLVMP